LKKSEIFIKKIKIYIIKIGIYIEKIKTFTKKIINHEEIAQIAASRFLNPSNRPNSTLPFL